MNVARPKARPPAVIIDQARGAPRAHPYLTATAATIGALALSALVNRHLAQKAVRDNPPQGQFLEINGVRLHYIERGAGEPLVLLVPVRRNPDERRNRGRDRMRIHDLPPVEHVLKTIS